MSFPRSIQTITGIASQGNVEIHGDVNIRISTGSPTAAKQPRVWKPFCNVPLPVPYFAGRKDLIAAMHGQIQQCSLEREYSKKIVVIHGLGGMGKSELVRKYVQTYFQDSIINNAAWINAESKNSLERSFKSLAEELNLQTQDKEVNALVSSIYKHLSEQSQTSLFIFDNAQQMRSENNVFGIFNFLPTVQLHIVPLIIITTRVNNWEIPENSENIIQINELSEDAAVEYLTKRFRLSLKQKHDKKIMNALKDLAGNLQCFPLGLTLAASNITISTLRSIPQEIKIYIQKLKGPRGDWIHDRHSTGTASNYDLIMNNVWSATLEKIQAQGQDGEAAIYILNVIAYLPPDEITVEEVAKVAEYSGISTSTAGFEMLELYSLISLPSNKTDVSDFEGGSDGEESDSDNETYQKMHDICIHRLVQRCTRDKLDREDNYTHLIKIAMFLAQQKEYLWDSNTIHQHLKERKWPKHSFLYSILLTGQENMFAYNFDILKDVHKVLVFEAKPCCAQNLKDDYKMLHTLNLFYVYSYSDVYKKQCEDWISKDPSYSWDHLQQIFVSSIVKGFKGLFMGTVDIKDLVKRSSIEVLIRIHELNSFQHTSSEEVQKEIKEMLVDTTGKSFNGSVETVGLLYKLLWGIWSCYERIPLIWYVKVGLKIHSGVYASITKAGGIRVDSYWNDDTPIPYWAIKRKLTSDPITESNRYVVELFRTRTGLQFLLHHLQYLDALTQTQEAMTDIHWNVSVSGFIAFLGRKWDFTKEFVQADLFMQTLYSITKKIFELNEEVFKEEMFMCLLTWFGLFGKNTCEDKNGVSWSIQSVEKEMIQLLDTSYKVRRVYLQIYFWEGDAVLKEFIQSSGCDQESIAVKAATRMLEYLNKNIHRSLL